MVRDQFHLRNTKRQREDYPEAEDRGHKTRRLRSQPSSSTLSASLASKRMRRGEAKRATWRSTKGARRPNLLLHGSTTAISSSSSLPPPFQFPIPLLPGHPRPQLLFPFSIPSKVPPQPSVSVRLIG